VIEAKYTNGRNRHVHPPGDGRATGVRFTRRVRSDDCTRAVSLSGNTVLRSRFPVAHDAALSVGTAVPTEYAATPSSFLQSRV